MTAEILRRAADEMEEFGPVHKWIAESLREEADQIDSGKLAEAEPESLDLARTYLEEAES